MSGEEIKNQLQNDEYYLPGNLGSASFGNTKCEIVQQFISKDGSVTLTLHPIAISSKQIDDKTIEVSIEQVITKQINEKHEQ